MDGDEAPKLILDRGRERKGEGVESSTEGERAREVHRQT